MRGQVPLALALLDSGADPNIGDAGFTPLEAVNAEGPGDPWIMGHLGYAYAKAGWTAEARRILATLTGAHPAATLHIAAVHAGLAASRHAGHARSREADDLYAHTAERR